MMRGREKSSGSANARRARFEGIYRENARAILAYGLRRCSSREDASDLLAETMLVAWRRLDDVPRGNEARLWLFGVAGRALANQLRSARRRTRLGERLRNELSEHHAPDPADRLTADESVLAAIKSLSDQDREVLLLSTWEDLKPKEIARALSLGEATVRTRLHRARGRLRESLESAGTSNEVNEPDMYRVASPRSPSAVEETP
jgi:RNA polymerase sigma factor (sigma-70 family)